MKYVIYGLLMLTGYGITFGLLPVLLPAWLAVDLILILILLTAQATKDYTALIIGAVIGLLIDLYIGPALFLNMFLYAVFGYLFAMLCSRLKRDGFLSAVIAVFVFYILKDVILSFYGIAYGVGILNFRLMWRFTLLSALLNAAVCLLLYFPVSRILMMRGMRSKRKLDFLRDYDDRPDWLEEWFEQYK